jgi:hypothetical protein
VSLGILAQIRTKKDNQLESDALFIELIILFKILKNKEELLFIMNILHIARVKWTRI